MIFQGVEPVSKPLEDSEQAGQLNESREDVVPILVAHNQPAAVKEPADAPLHAVAAPVAPQLATVLGRGAPAVLAMRADQIDTPPAKCGAQRITVGD